MGPATSGTVELRGREDVVPRRGYSRFGSSANPSVLCIESKEGCGPGRMLARSRIAGVDVDTVDELAEGIIRLTAGGFDAVILEACPETPQGLEGLRLLRETAPGLPVVIVCAHHRAGEHLGLRAIRLGAQECLCSDEVAPMQLHRALAHAIERSGAVNDERRLAYELETALSNRNRELEAVNRELEAFNYTVSHDLRQPLCAIVGMSRLLLEEHAGDLGPLPLQLLRRILESGRAMESLIGALLDLARVDGEELRPARVNLSRLFEEALAELCRRSPERVVRPFVTSEIWVEGDPALLKLVMDNLAGNAWKFSACRHAARIELGRLNMEDGEETIYVRDDGSGFDPRRGSELFKPFRRLHDEVEGLGVGLATVERVIRRHGGRVWAEGRPGEGATFYFTLGTRRAEPPSR